MPAPRLTVSSQQRMAELGGQITLTSGDGVKHSLTSANLAFIIGLSWGTLILSWILNGVYYKVTLSRNDKTILLIFFLYFCRYTPLQST